MWKKINKTKNGNLIEFLLVIAVLIAAPITNYLNKDYLKQ